MKRFSNEDCVFNGCKGLDCVVHSSVRMGCLIFYMREIRFCGSMKYQYFNGFHGLTLECSTPLFQILCCRTDKLLNILKS